MNQSMIAPATETSPAVKGGKGKGKAKGKGTPKGGSQPAPKDAPQKTSGAQVPNNVRRNLCRWFVIGNFKKGADCRYEHSKAANFNEQNYYADLMAPRPASSSKSGSSSKGGRSSRAKSLGKKGVCKFFAKGHCRMGDRCHYEHRKSPSAPASESNCAGGSQSGKSDKAGSSGKGGPKKGDGKQNKGKEKSTRGSVTSSESNRD